MIQTLADGANLYFWNYDHLVQAIGIRVVWIADHS